MFQIQGSRPGIPVITTRRKPCKRPPPSWGQNRSIKPFHEVDSTFHRYWIIGFTKIYNCFQRCNRRGPMGFVSPNGQNFWKMCDLTNFANIPYIEHRYFWGEMTPLRRGVHLHTRGEKIGVSLLVFGAEGAAKNFRALFCKFWGNFLIKK